MLEGIAASLGLLGESDTREMARQLLHQRYPVAMMRPVLFAIAVCLAAASLEGLLAGRGVKQRFAELRMPRFSPSLRLWIIIGIAYYLTCGVVLYRLFSLPSVGALGGRRSIALVMLIAVMLTNAFWNYLFFRRRNLLASNAVSLGYSVMSIALLGVLFTLDRAAAWWFVPYALYLIYANAWGFALMRRSGPECGKAV
jgi:tryptophan-rich sensory protein